MNLRKAQCGHHVSEHNGLLFADYEIPKSWATSLLKLKLLSVSSMSQRLPNDLPPNLETLILSGTFTGVWITKETFASTESQAWQDSSMCMSFSSAWWASNSQNTVSISQSVMAPRNGSVPRGQFVASLSSVQRLHCMPLSWNHLLKPA
jgi:hypothetical protein